MLNFQQATEELEKGNMVTRKSWDQSNAKVCIGMQVPDENSFMTDPYMYLQVNEDNRSPLELTWSLALAKDFYVIDMSEDDGLLEEEYQGEDSLKCIADKAKLKVVEDE